MGNAVETQLSYNEAQTKPDFVMLTGDLVYSEGRASEYRRKLFPQFLSEVTSPKSDSHLGQVFDDGPADKGGHLYCMNGEALNCKPFPKKK